jgi:hypothetical protein
MYKEEDFFQVFGKINILFATLDFLVTQTIFQLVNDSNIHLLSKITNKTTLQNKFRFIKDLNPEEVVNLSVLSELKNLLPKAFEVGESRNRFIHDLWVFNPTTIPAGKIKRVEIKSLENKMFDFLENETNLDELNIFLQELGNMQIKIDSISKRLPS